MASKDDFGTQLGVNTGLAPVRTVKQTLTNGQKQTAWGNIGLNVYIIDQSKFGTALTDAELTAYNAAEAILVTNHQKYVSALYLLASNSGSNAMFYSTVNSSTFMRIRIDDSNTIVNEKSVLSDQNAIVFSTNQSLSLAQSNRAIGNVGTGFYIVPYGGTVPAADLERAVGASALILTNTPSENMPKIYMRSGIAPNGNIYFYAFASAYDVVSVNLNPTTGAVSPVTTNNITAGLLSYGSVQNLSIDDTNRVMSNIGLDIMVVNLTNGSATLTQEQADALLASNGVIFTGTDTDAVKTKRMKNRIFFRAESLFYAVYNSAYVMYAEYNPDTRVIVVRGRAGITDLGSVRFTAQTLTKEQQMRGLSNIGLDYCIIKVTNNIATLTQEQENALLSAKGVLIVGTASYEPSLRRIYTVASTSGSIVSGYSILTYQLACRFDYDKSTRTLTVMSSPSPLSDQYSVKFTVQNLSESQQAQARKNIGIAQGLLNDADFIAELKTKLGLT